ncbi:MAG: 2-C-methyl-D-erythritol 2,4-cyclodiphosphate synthase [Deltaproteobacteria bacterium]|nr:2-C-methyl-D-erythritol 2,4-cyclodiphosphate synthase [Deltaproteobacteria bacterium]MBF0526628.1 2-C-methyl-D-erythritol 2,4-cyclodiphosphate synthase [Deltaproteobacteria bacterium]
MFRIGFGYDAHQLTSDRLLVLGGVTIPYDLGLLGHSDADVLSHAVCDAVLGAAGLGDIGRHFPDTDPRWKGILSLTLLTETVEMLKLKKLRIVNVDSTIVAQRPKLKDYIPEMESNLAAALGLDPDQVNVKATTTEGMGFTGQGEGMAAYAVALITGSLG